jgi:nicotinamidase-related amidase
VSEQLNPDRAALVIIDWQARLLSAMNTGFRETHTGRIANLKWLSENLNLPVVVSEQYPRGLGSTADALGVTGAISKTCFSAMREPAFKRTFSDTGRDQVVLVGMETHICVAQTCADLLEQGCSVWVVADACLSRRRLDWQFGLDHMRDLGARIITAEAALFTLIRDAKSPLFKELSKRIQE